MNFLFRLGMWFPGLVCNFAPSLDQTCHLLTYMPKINCPLVCIKGTAG
jgi:hypothetical protein